MNLEQRYHLGETIKENLTKGIIQSMGGIKK